MPIEENGTAKEPETINSSSVAATYSRIELINRAKEIFGCNPEIVVGALHGNDADQLTIGEVKQKIKEFLERKVI